jgi:hypothetical protein
MKIHPIGAELFHADRQTDMKLTVAFLNFANTPNNSGRKLHNEELHNLY